MADNLKTELFELLLLQENPTITANSIAKELNKNIRTIQRDLDELTKQEKIKCIGSDKTGEWVVIPYVKLI